MKLYIEFQDSEIFFPKGTLAERKAGLKEKMDIRNSLGVLEVPLYNTLINVLK